MDSRRQNVFGWAYVAIDRDGAVNVDHSGDFVSRPEELEAAAYRFVLMSRRGDVDHSCETISELIESIIFTPDKQRALGLPPGTIPVGWWVGFHVRDPRVWRRVESGSLTAFSIAGRWRRTATSAI
ncbi:hypothetical protein H9L09_03815 [Nocardioides mesophilus]|uniref:Phage-like element PBSX protein XkdF domain-containing protein n=1 Tax=Nocardioides mesophilus TaxID=433659 RepID=A0A7G9RD89_9ACTN|nr:hypothetical protein H9L09_03815 [Nocardioides mesophilus]